MATIAMAETYTMLQKKIAALQQKAEKARGAELNGVIDRIKVAIAHYGISAEQLFSAGGQRARATRKAQIPLPARYSDGSGNTWSGRGPRPGCLRNAVAAGRSLSESETTDGVPAATAPQPSRPRTTKRAKGRVQYRDGAGNTWSGMGPKPR